MASGQVPADTVEWLFRAAFGRRATTEELAAYASRTALELLADLRASEEARGEETAEPDIELLFDLALHRPASSQDIDAILREGWSRARILRMLTATEEFVECNPAHDEPFLNMHVPGLERWAHPPGTCSPTGAVEVGRDGWIFVTGGSNAWLDQYLGVHDWPESWLADWLSVIDHRVQRAAAAGVWLHMLIIPDKLAVMPEHLGRPLHPQGPRPVQELLGATDATVHYPLAALRDAGTPFLRADSHLSLEGTLILHDEVVRALGVDHDPRPGLELGTTFIYGELGMHLRPEVGEIVTDVIRGRATWAHNTGPGEPGHPHRQRQAARNPAAPRRERVLVFGDSHAFSGRQGLARLAVVLAETFAEVDYAWAPFGWDSRLVAELEPDIVIVECAERFLARVPPLDMHGSSA